MGRLYAVAAVVLVAIIGFIKLWRQDRNISEQHDFAVEFINRLKNYLESNGENAEIYTWLINRSPRMQTQMGSEGVYGAYRPPFQNYQIRNYPVILNMLPDLHRTLNEDYQLGTRLAGDYATALQEALIRHIGTIEDVRKAHASELKNPIIWLREGVRSIIAFPVSLLSWFGLFGSATLEKITENLIFSSVSAIIGFIGFLSSVVTVIIGWDQFVVIMKKWFF